MPKYHLRFTCNLALKKHYYNYNNSILYKHPLKNNMENLPSEILEFVFHPLSKKDDIQKCYNTNSKWRHIVKNMFANKSINIQRFVNICTIILLSYIFITNIQSYICFVINNFRDWIFIFYIGRSAKMF